MTEKTAIEKRASHALIPDNAEIAVLTQMAKNANNSKFYNSLGGEAGILSIMLLARELDIPPMQALSGGIWNIQGKVEMSARMMNMKLRQAGHKLKIEQNESGCSITGTRKDTGETLTVTFDKKDAERAGVLGKDVWKKFPREMYFARALSLLARQLFPDVIGNCYVQGEISDGESAIEAAGEIKAPARLVANNAIEVSASEPIESKQEEDQNSGELSVEPITPKQAKDLWNMMNKQKSLHDELIAHFGVATLTDLPVCDLEAAIEFLSAKRKDIQA